MNTAGTLNPNKIKTPDSISTISPINKMIFEILLNLSDLIFCLPKKAFPPTINKMKATPTPTPEEYQDSEKKVIAY